MLDTFILIYLKITHNLGFDMGIRHDRKSWRVPKDQNYIFFFNTVMISSFSKSREVQYPRQLMIFVFLSELDFSINTFFSFELYGTKTYASISEAGEKFC